METQLSKEDWSQKASFFTKQYPQPQNVPPTTKCKSGDMVKNHQKKKKPTTTEEVWMMCIQAMGMHIAFILINMFEGVSKISSKVNKGWLKDWLIYAIWAKWTAKWILFGELIRFGSKCFSSLCKRQSGHGCTVTEHWQTTGWCGQGTKAEHSSPRSVSDWILLCHLTETECHAGILCRLHTIQLTRDKGKKHGYGCGRPSGRKPWTIPYQTSQSHQKGGSWSTKPSNRKYR